MNNGNGKDLGKLGTIVEILKQLGNLGMGLIALLMAFALLAYQEYQDHPLRVDRIRAMEQLARVIDEGNKREAITDERFLSLVEQNLESLKARTEIEAEILRELRERGRQ